MLFPAFLTAGIILCGIPLALHLLRPKPRRVVAFPSLRFLQKSVMKDKRRHKLLRRTVLALRCLALLLLGLAFARPFTETVPNRDGRLVVIAVDNSYSMQANNRWKERREWAAQTLDELHRGDSAGLLRMHPKPQWILPPGSDPAVVRQALDTLGAGFESGDYRAALRMAAERLRRSDARKRVLVWMGDHQDLAWKQVDLSKQLPPGIALHLPDLPPELELQAAITGVNIKGGSNAGIAEITIRSFSSKGTRRRVSLMQDDTILATRDVELPPSTRPVRVSFALPKNDAALGIRAQLDPDGLTADDVAYALETSVGAPEVLLAAAPADLSVDYLALALESCARMRSEGLSVRTLPAGAWPVASVAVLRGETPFTKAGIQALEHFLSEGGKAIVFLDGGALQLEWLAKHGISTGAPEKASTAHALRDWDLEHAALAPFTDGNLSPLLQLTFPFARSLTRSGAWPLARWPDHSVALAETSILGGTVLLAGFSPDGRGETLSRSPSFVPLLDGTLRWLSEDGGPTESLFVGDRLPLSGSGIWACLSGPKKGAELQVTDGVQLDAPGIFRFTPVEGLPEMFAVNLRTDESDLRPIIDPGMLKALENPDSAPPVAKAGTASLNSDDSLWWWLLLSAFCLLLGELRLANRTSP